MTTASSAGRTRVPRSTYRLQVRAGFDLDAAAAVTEYLHDLGVDWAYLSPILQAASGSDHGYDVTDPTRVDTARGGEAGLARFSAAARAADLGILVDIVPNHQGIAVPAENPWWWDVLRLGESSLHAAFFDIDWAWGNHRVVLPVLGGELDEVIVRGEIEVAPPAHADADDGTARYFDLVLPLAPGTAPLRATSDPSAVRDVLARQHWELVFWRRDAERLNYRRFFTVTSLAGVRVDDPEVFDATHSEVLRWMRSGLVDGLRIDHPDGLADPGGYLDRLAAATDGAYTVIEKILEAGEELPGWWATAGTTGYDALGEIERVFVDPRGEEPLSDATHSPIEWEALITGTKRTVADTSQAAEVGRLVRCLPSDVRGDLGEAVARDALAEMLAHFAVYRAYLPAGADHLTDAASRALDARPELSEALARIVPCIADARSELSRRFMQTSGPVMAKGVEDRAFYRFGRLTNLNEVGGDPSRFALSPRRLHAAFARRQAMWPDALTALTTHDTKRSEDTRARIAVLAEVPARWRAVRSELLSAASTGVPALDDVLWQAVVGAWSGDPQLRDRLRAYAEKAAREGAVGTSWEDPDALFESGVRELIDTAFGVARPVVEELVAEIAGAGRSNALAAKLLQLAGPGVPDVYQGTELWDHSLVDPDNRRAVDYDTRRAFLARIDAGWQPPVDEMGAAKLLLVSRTLRLRRDRPELFTRYTPLDVVGDAAAHALAFDRGGAIAVVTRLPIGLATRGGWGHTAVMLPAGAWRDELTGRDIRGGVCELADVLANYPVALLSRAH